MRLEKPNSSNDDEMKDPLQGCFEDSTRMFRKRLRACVGTMLSGSPHPFMPGT